MQLRLTLNQIMVGGASVFKSGEEPNKLLQGFSFMGHGAVYQLAPQNASEQFRYWTATNMDKHELMLLFFNLVNDNKFVKEGAKIILDSIRTNTKIYVPLPTEELSLQEAISYDSMTDEKFAELEQQNHETVKTEGL